MYSNMQVCIVTNSTSSINYPNLRKYTQKKTNRAQSPTNLKQGSTHLRQIVLEVMKSVKIALHYTNAVDRNHGVGHFDCHWDCLYREPQHISTPYKVMSKLLHFLSFVPIPLFLHHI
ncbi:hypothetical protein EGR_10916 [Echinococcus granulosus]|uniref:Uncharacterized protein n=1 Tax=Echinococcus granulosus TaxID=6210 RepID=W6TZH6_ECHGR|nr:hypothetical protein EGR_10916 [Echinococcus granulosus]EUB54225.1 hypothetical protein EGR_10916 [Echinococcus granulosus]